jgi:PAS domain S-box-containing protein
MTEAIAVSAADPPTPERDARGADAPGADAPSAVEQALRESEARFRRLADHLPDGFIYQVAEVPPDQVRFVYASAGVEALLGLTPAQVVANPQALYGRIVPEDLPRVRATELAAASGRTMFDCQFRSQGKGGAVHLLHCRSAPRQTDSGGWVWDGIAVDITERVRAEEALREADRRKDEFLALLAHELRNPLAPIRNALQLMRLAKAGSADLTWTRDVIERQVQQLGRLVDDLLDVSRISRGKLQLRRDRVALADVVAHAVEAWRPTIDARQHTLTVTLPDEPVLLDADPMRLAQVLGNLLANAAKYTEPGGKIEIAARVDGPLVELAVRDSGVGIPAEMLDRVFDLFMQVERSITQAAGGLGIGLTLVKRLVELHGGSVEARSAGPGQGSEFLVRLPRVPPPAG